MISDNELLNNIANSLEKIEDNISVSCQSLDEIKMTLKELLNELKQMRQFERR